MQLLTRGKVDVTFVQHLFHHLDNSKPKQANLNIIETVMFDSPFASKLHGYVELSCTDSHKFTDCSSIERQRCHTIWIFYLNLVLSKFHKGFSILFIYFGFCFVWLCFILVCVNFVKFRKGKYKLLFYAFHSRTKGGRRSMLWNI